MTAQADLCGRSFRLFCNVDGEDLRNTWKYIFGTKLDAEKVKLLTQWDNISCQERVDQLADKLTGEEKTALEAQLYQMGGNSLDKMSLLDALRWWSLGSHTPTGLNDIALHTRLKSGQSELHRRIFDHSVSTGNLSYSFGCAVKKVEDKDGLVRVHMRDGQIFKAKAIICTLPLNVLASVEFSPALPEDKIKAAHQGSVNRCNKIHVDINGPDYLSWSSLASPGKGLVSAFGDHLTPSQNSHLVSFGPDPESETGLKSDSPEAILEAVKYLLPEEKREEVIFNRIVSNREPPPASNSWNFF